jgi:hypothetical protein
MSEVPKPKPPKRRPGRPADTIYGSLGVADAAERSLGWSDGAWAGHPHLVAQVVELVDAGAVLAVPGVDGYVIVASSYDPVSVMALMAKVADTETGFSGDIPVAAIAALALRPVPVGQVA